MAGTLSEEEWSDLLDLIQEGKCTPFIGAGASANTLPLAKDLAHEWAHKYGYPLQDTHDLARVAQFLSIKRYEMFPKELVARAFRAGQLPDFSDPAESHAVLADLNLPLYITTNWDNFMVKAIQARRQINPQREFCRWNKAPQVTGEKSVLKAGYRPDRATPLVYHLHGHTEVLQSMVLTEDDYLDFLVKATQERDLLHPAIRTALAGTSLLFVGYSLSDWNFRVLFRSIMGAIQASVQYPSIAIQLPPGNLSAEARQEAQDYLKKYFEKIQMIRLGVYWGDERQFSGELRQRWVNYRQ